MKELAGVSRPARRCCEIGLVAAGLLLIGCHPHGAGQKPLLEITRVPLATAGGPDQLDYIEGRASGVAPGQRIILYVRSGVWWIQPFANQPFTVIQPDSTWKNATHLGTDYAALLVEPGYRPASKVQTLPEVGKGVVAVISVKGKAGPPVVAKVIHFSGYDWTVRVAGSERGGETNAYDPSNAWTDSDGYLHLRMAMVNGRWSCGEVSLNRSLGYGTYRFVVHDSAHLPPSAVVGMFTWDDAQSNDSRNELDIELSRWGNPASKNAQYVVQPFYVPENVSRFMAPAGVLTHMFRWEPGNVSFKTVRGKTIQGSAGPEAKPVAEHIFTSGIPAPASETVHVGMYDFHHSTNPSQQPAEVVIEKFEYLP